MGGRPADQLPAGHVSLTVFIGPADDVGTDMYGPVITESDTHIRISVWNEPMGPFNKQNCTIVRSTEDTPATTP